MSQWVQTMPTLEYDYGEDEMSEWLDIGPTVEEESGWGVEESEYTTGLDYSKFTPEQVRQAKIIAQQISHETKQYGEARHFDKSMRDRKTKTAVRHDAAVGVHSAEDAIELLRRQKERQATNRPLYGAPGQHQPQQQHHHQPQQQHYAPQPVMPTYQYAPGYDEPGGVAWLRAELQKCQANIRQFGDPPPQHAARFLIRFGSELLQFLPNPPPDVKAQVLSSFAQVGWDVRIRQPLQRSHPPNGQQLTSLVFGLCCFFSHRNGLDLPPPEAGIVNVPPRAVVRPPPRHVQDVQPRGGGYYKGEKGGKGGKGYQGKGNYTIPKPRDGSGYAAGGNQQTPRVNQPQQRGEYRPAGAQSQYGGRGGKGAGKGAGRQ